MKRLTDEEIQAIIAHGIATYTDDVPVRRQKIDRDIADAQLAKAEPLIRAEAIKEEQERFGQWLAAGAPGWSHPAIRAEVLREVIADLEREKFAEPQMFPEHGREPVIIALDAEEWEMMKQEWHWRGRVFRGGNP